MNFDDVPRIHEIKRMSDEERQAMAKYETSDASLHYMAQFDAVIDYNDSWLKRRVYDRKLKRLPAEYLEFQSGIDSVRETFHFSGLIPTVVKEKMDEAYYAFEKGMHTYILNALENHDYRHALFCIREVERKASSVGLKTSDFIRKSAYRLEDLTH